MNKHRINTTISTKHWEILKKHTEKFDTQQKVLEVALERLENGSKQKSAFSPEEDFWIRIRKEYGQNLCVLHKDLVKECFKLGGSERIIKMANEMNLTEMQVLFFCNKPLKECSLREIMEAIVHTFKMVNIFDIIEYKDHGNFYLLNITHILNSGGGNQTPIKLPFEKLFEKYGAKTESEESENNLFMKIYKNSK